MSQDTVLPYAGSSGWSGSDSSRERAEREDADGTTSQRQAMVMNAVKFSFEYGITWKELAEQFGWHHGQASGALSVLHKEGRLSRLKNKRNRCALYVLPEYVFGRDESQHGSKKQRVCANCGCEVA